MGEVIPFKRPEEPPAAEHDPSTTIVEQVELTDEIKQAFENAGFDMENWT